MRATPTAAPARAVWKTRVKWQAGGQKLHIAPQEVLVCSTGIIGHQLPMEKMESAISQIELANDDEAVARAFMTTDLVPKFCAASAEIDGKIVTVGGQAKGVGMIGPENGFSDATRHDAGVSHHGRANRAEFAANPAGKCGRALV
jgi:N-acetylglutamate synthase/N-acetylornithine aminotransferase